MVVVVIPYSHNNRSIFLFCLFVLSIQHANFIPIVRVGKRGAYYLVHDDLPRLHNYLEVYWPCAGGLSAVNAIGTHLRDPINSGLIRWRMAVS